MGWREELTYLGNTKCAILGHSDGDVWVSTSHITSFFLTFVPNLLKYPWPTGIGQMLCSLSFCLSVEHLWGLLHTLNRASDKPPMDAHASLITRLIENSSLVADEKHGRKSIGQNRGGFNMPEASGCVSDLIPGICRKTMLDSAS